MEYVCAEKKCTYDGNGPYTLTLPAEACIDEHNCAVVFCPYCHSKMVIRKPAEQPAGG